MRARRLLRRRGQTIQKRTVTRVVKRTRTIRTVTRTRSIRRITRRKVTGRRASKRSGRITNKRVKWGWKAPVFYDKGGFKYMKKIRYEVWQKFKWVTTTTIKKVKKGNQIFTYRRMLSKPVADGKPNFKIIDTKIRKLGPSNMIMIKKIQMGKRIMYRIVRRIVRNVVRYRSCVLKTRTLTKIVNGVKTTSVQKVRSCSNVPSVKSAVKRAERKAMRSERRTIKRMARKELKGAKMKK